ncbi:MAG: KpsF/GutQ family sugar-phosphate isomerase [bacterium]
MSEDVVVDAARLIEYGREVVRREGEALRMLADSLDGSFVETVRVLERTLSGGGRIVVSGIGKSGLVARKIAATLCSTGAPAVYLHPVEAIHGDLGLITPGDALIAISRSGQFESLDPIVEAAGRHGVPILGWTAVAESPLAEEADVAIVLEVGPEAGPDDVIPSASSTAMMALGDAVAIALFHERGLGPEDFARLHPGGQLGRRLTMRVRELMHTGAELPLATPDAPLLEVLAEITRKRLGLAVIVEESGRLAGLVTDGDVRRALLADPESLTRPVAGMMTRDPRTISEDELVVRAIERMEQPARRITALIVADEGKLLGVLHLHDCLAAGFR